MLEECAVLVLFAFPAMADVSADRARALEHMVTQDCGSCHGLTLKGGLGRPLTREALANADPEGLTLIILDGIPGTAMPPWRPLLTEDEALWIANYLKGKD
ncbi:c-type cytochrome [Tabrizicola oligotrophica]|uniref:Cytochrome c n=1 Tax=Tabrizicola oligotrophica TaxID=2710650 RepID=A0A6M0QXG4_9RHOB|nr:cytochrome c [Tabrizicola oligotrophica]